MKMQKSLLFVKKNLKNKYQEDKNYNKVRDQVHYKGKYRCAAHNICNFKYSVSRKIPIAFHDRSNYDHKFIIKELAEKFEYNLLVQEKTLKTT